MARQKALDTSLFQLQERKATSEARQAYYSTRDDINAKTSAMRQWAMYNNDLIELMGPNSTGLGDIDTTTYDDTINQQQGIIDTNETLLQNTSLSTSLIGQYEQQIYNARNAIATAQNDSNTAINNAILGAMPNQEAKDKATEILNKMQALGYQPDSVTAGEAKVDSDDLEIDGETIEELNTRLSDEQYEYQEENDRIKSYYETEYQMIEEEAADREMDLDQEQTDVEAQMEAISQEMQAVSDAISSQIQSSTIKLA